MRMVQASMTKAFLDTTILVNRLLKTGELKKQAQRALVRYDVTELPVYAIKEFRAGVFYNLAWAHNKLLETKSVSKMIEIAARWRKKPNLVSTVFEFYASHQRLIETEKLSSLNAKYNGNTTRGEFECYELRINLKSALKRAWARRRRVTSAVIQDLGCFDEEKPIMKSGYFEQQRMGCSPSYECVLASDFRRDIARCDLLRDASKNQGHHEGQRRAKALRKVAHTQNAIFLNKDCRNLGDAYFAFFCPNDSVILTTNERDHRVLAAALGKRVETP